MTGLAQKEAMGRKKWTLKWKKKKKKPIRYSYKEQGSYNVPGRRNNKATVLSRFSLLVCIVLVTAINENIVSLIWVLLVFVGTYLMSSTCKTLTFTRVILCKIKSWRINFLRSELLVQTVKIAGSHPEYVG